jgi:Ca2+-binding RTX toxin-like protein
LAAKPPVPLIPILLVGSVLAGVHLGSSAKALGTTGHRGAPTLSGREYLSRGYLVRDPRAYAAAKASADRRAALMERSLDTGTPTASSSATRPSASSWEGARDSSVTPSDSTGAIGPARYVEMINLKMAVYSRAHKLLMLTSLFNLTGDPFLTDPQVIWDPDTGRFYYLILDDSILSGQPDTVDFKFGFSSDGTPTSLSDWCNYSINASYGSGANTFLPDQPHLGDSKDFLFWGANVFDVGQFPPPFVSADAVWITKPPPGSTCPAANTFLQGKVTNLLNADSSQTSTPIGVNQTDSDPTGWLIGSEDPTVGLANALTLFHVTKNPDGTANVQQTGMAVPVPTFDVPANAIQGGVSGHRLDTIDGRLTQAVSAKDSSRGGTLAIWTQHTVFGGAGAAVRWYEIAPSGPRVLQRGTISNSNLFVFNAAISPDRRNDGVHQPKFGDGMGIGFTTTSARTDSTIWVASKVGSHALSPWRLVRQSPGPEIDDSCTRALGGPPCRWGDFMGASPDPAADPTRAHGAVWMTSMWNAKSTNIHNNDWRTQNWRMRIVANRSSCTMIGTAGPDVLVGSNVHDVLCGNGGGDSLFGEGGNDTLLGGAGHDLLDGGPGTDRCVSGGGLDTKVSCEL